MFDVPDYVRWLGEQDYSWSTRTTRQQLQLLSWQYPGDYWVLKSPAHLFALDTMLAVFPDACFVITHRDPLRVIPSLCSLAAGFRGILTDRLDLRRLGAEIVEALAVGPERAIASRARPGATPLVSSTSHTTGSSPTRSRPCARLPALRLRLQPGIRVAPAPISRPTPATSTVSIAIGSTTSASMPTLSTPHSPAIAGGWPGTRSPSAVDPRRMPTKLPGHVGGSRRLRVAIPSSIPTDPGPTLACTPIRANTECGAKHAFFVPQSRPKDLTYQDFPPKRKKIAPFGDFRARFFISLTIYSLPTRATCR